MGALHQLWLDVDQKEKSFDNRACLKDEIISSLMAVLYPSKGLNSCVEKRMKAFCLSHVGLNLILTF